MKKNYSGLGFAALLFGIVTVFVLASCKQAKVVEKPLETAQTQAEQTAAPAPGPHPEAAVSVPEVSKQNENILFVYRHTGPGYAEAYGFDTYIFRLLTDGSGQITGGVAYQRTIGGEIEAIHYNTSFAGDEISLAVSGPGQKSWSDILKRKENRIDVSGTHNMLVTFGKNLVFSSSDGSYSESYSVDPAGKDLPGEIRKGNSVLEKGVWSYPESGKAVYAQTKPMMHRMPRDFRFRCGSRIRAIIDLRRKGLNPSMRSMPPGSRACWPVTMALSTRCFWT